MSAGSIGSTRRRSVRFRAHLSAPSSQRWSPGGQRRSLRKEEGPSVGPGGGSVSNEHGWVRGYEGLVVADASVIPTNLGVNPQHTIMGLARTFAEDLLQA
jgi:hypothetical protein